MSERLDFVLRLIDKITGPAKRASKSLGGIDKSLTSIGKNKALDKMGKDAKRASISVKSLGKAGDKMLSTSANLNLAANSMKQLSGAAAGAFLAPVMEAATLEKAMSAVRARTSDFTESQVELAKQLGRDTKFTAIEAAQAMEKLAMAGFNSKQQMQSLGSVLDLDAASGMDSLAESADIVTNIMTGFRLSASQTTGTADQLVRIVNNSNTTLSELGQTMSFVAPISAELGVSLRETTIMAGALGDAAIKGTRAGTGLRLLLTNLAGASPPAAKALKKLKIATEDAGGNMRPVNEILGDLVEKFASLGTAQRAVQAQKIFGQRGMSGGLVLMNALADKATGSITKLNKASDDLSVTAKSTAQVMEDNLLGDVTKVESAFSALKIAIGDQFTPELRGLATEVREIIPPMVTWVKENKELVKSLGKSLAVFAATTAALSGIAVAASSASLIFGGLAKASAGMLLFWDKIGMATIWVAAKFSALSTAVAPVFATLWAGTKFIAGLAASFVSLPVVALAALGALAVGIYVWWDEVESFMMGLGASMYDIGQSIANGVVNGWNAIWDNWSPVSHVMGVVDSIKSALGIASPSKVMAGIGENMAQGLRMGMNGGANANAPARFAEGAAGAAAGAAGARTMVFRPTVQVTVAGGGGASEGEGVADSVTTALRGLFDDATAALGAG